MGLRWSDLRTKSGIVEKPRRTLLLVPGVVFACSVINAPDDVLESPAAGGAGGSGGAAATTGGSGGAGGSDVTSSGGSAGDPSTSGGSGGGATTTGGGVGGNTASTGGTRSTTTGMGGSTTTGAGGEPPTGRQDIGLVAVSARVLDGNNERVLSVLAEDGAELHRETDLPVAAIAYDGAEDRDVWFVFLAESFPIDPTRPADLEVRRFNDRTNTWTTISEVTQLPPPRADQLVVLNGRLAYLSYNTSDSSETLTLLDTRDLNAVEEVTIPFEVSTTGQLMTGLLGARGSATNPDGDGGTINLMLSTCGANQCALEIQPVFVGSSLTKGNLEPVGNYAGVPAFTNALEDRRGFIARYSVTDTRVLQVEFDPFDPSTMTSTNLPGGAQRLGGMLLLECENVTGLSEGDGAQLRGVSLQGGLSSTIDLMRQGQRLYFEPFSQKAIAPYNADPSNTMPLSMGDDGPDGTIDAFLFTGNGASAPSMEALSSSDWAPPQDLAPLTLTVRTPEAFACE